jgi:hypothetical protein
LVRLRHNDGDRASDDGLVPGDGWASDGGPSSDSGRDPDGRDLGRRALDDGRVPAQRARRSRKTSSARQTAKMIHGATTIKSLPVISPALCCGPSGITLMTSAPAQRARRVKMTW